VPPTPFKKLLSKPDSPAPKIELSSDCVCASEPVAEGTVAVELEVGTKGFVFDAAVGEEAVFIGVTPPGSAVV
jgi:hypothetical protein